MRLYCPLPSAMGHDRIITSSIINGDLVVPGEAPASPATRSSCTSYSMLLQNARYCFCQAIQGSRKEWSEWRSPVDAQDHVPHQRRNSTPRPRDISNKSQGILLSLYPCRAFLEIYFHRYISEFASGLTVIRKYEGICAVVDRLDAYAWLNPCSPYAAQLSTFHIRVEEAFRTIGIVVIGQRGSQTKK